MEKFYIDTQGNYIGSFTGSKPPQGAIQVSTPPNHADDKYVSGKWVVNEMAKWKRDMEVSDSDLPRWAEDMIATYGSENLPEKTKLKFERKKARRAEKP